jgi:hypothetical protein
MPFAWIAATLLGALVPAAIVSMRLAGPALPMLWLFAFGVALGHAIILGLPAALLYRAKRWHRPDVAVATGFLIGAIPIGILNWPVRNAPNSTMSFGDTLLNVDGVPTLAGWLEFLRVLGMFGSLGAVGALVFWLTLRWSGALDDASSE